MSIPSYVSKRPYFAAFEGKWEGFVCDSWVRLQYWALVIVQGNGNFLSMGNFLFLCKVVISSTPQLADCERLPMLFGKCPRNSDIQMNNNRRWMYGGSVVCTDRIRLNNYSSWRGTPRSIHYIVILWLHKSSRRCSSAWISTFMDSEFLTQATTSYYRIWLNLAWR